MVVVAVVVVVVLVVVLVVVVVVVLLLVVVLVVAVAVVVLVVLIVLMVLIVDVAVEEALRVSYFGLWRHSYDLPSRAGLEVPRSAKYKEVRDFRTPIPKTRSPEVQGQITNPASSPGRLVS